LPLLHCCRWKLQAWEEDYDVDNVDVVDKKKKKKNFLVLVVLVAGGSSYEREGKSARPLAGGNSLLTKTPSRKQPSRLSRLDSTRL